MNQDSAKLPHIKILYPILEFARLEISSGILLLSCAVFALIWANSPWSESYYALWQTELTITLGSLHLSESLLHWINDGLMAVFFFVIGLEIKRELLVGQLSSLKHALLPVVAALGGMLVPAIIYVIFNTGTVGASGWGIPMATDIAFALGIVALLGRRIPQSLKIFLIALAIVDDIGAVMVIALFYTAEISWLSLAVGGGFLVALIAANWSQIRHPLVYALLGLGLWLAFLESGVHTTVAGVLVAMTIPARSRLDTHQFLDKARFYLQRFAESDRPGESVLSNHKQQETIEALEVIAEQAETPLQRLERALHPWAIFLIMPLFALANAGVPLVGNLLTAITHPVGIGIIFGLVIGKPLGITFFTWLAAFAGLAELPSGVKWSQLLGLGWLAGIGFTMSLFIANLAFTGNILAMAKIGILIASLIAGVGGWLLVRIVSAFSPAPSTRSQQSQPKTSPQTVGHSGG